MIKNWKKGQATVEYILLIAMVAGAVMALLSFSAPINQRLESAKQGMVDKLSGNYKLKRSDFFTKKPKPAGELTGEGSGGGGGGGGGGAGGKGMAKTQGVGGEAPGLAKSQGGGAAAGEATTQEIQTRTKGGYEYETSDQERMNYVDAYNKNNYGHGAGAGAEGGAEGSRTELLAEAGKDNGISMGRKRGSYEDEYRKAKAAADKEWGIGKIIIIIIVLFFFVFFIIKARQRRD